MLQMHLSTRLTAVIRSLDEFEQAYKQPATLDGLNLVGRVKQELVSLQSLVGLLPKQRGASTLFTITTPLRRLSIDCLQYLCQKLELDLGKEVDVQRQNLVSALGNYISTASILLPMYTYALTSKAC